MHATMEAPHTLAAVTDAGVGENIRRRRTSLGVTVRALAERAGVDRGRLSAIEDGASARASTVGAIERALSDLEEEMGGPYDTAESTSEGLVKYRLKGNFGVDVVVEGPVANIDELEAAVERLIKRMQTPPEKSD